METKSNSEYLTKDIGEAAALLSSSVKLRGLQRDSNFYWFVFEDKKRCQEVANQYWFGQLLINAKSYQDALRTLKDSMYARKWFTTQMYMDNIKITIYLKKYPKLLANANIAINTDFGYITIKHFCIWKSNLFNQRLNEEINITPPGKPAFGRFFETVFFEDRNKWYEIEMMIYEEFSKKRSNDPNFKNQSEEINPDDIPI